jgi:hypothetical protein
MTWNISNIRFFQFNEIQEKIISDYLTKYKENKFWLFNEIQGKIISDCTVCVGSD